MTAVDVHHESSSAGRRDGQDEPRRRPLDQLLVVGGLCGLAVAQPVLDLFGKNPTALHIRQVEGFEIVLFAVAVIVVPPVALWLTALAAGRLDRRTGWFVHLATVAMLFALVGVLWSKAISGGAAGHWLVAVLSAALGTWAYVRFDAMLLWLRVLCAANVVFLASFVFLAPVSVWITQGTQTADDVSFSDVGEGDQPPSLVMVVLDELPTQSILGAGGTIDPVRFPNLSRFSEDATWYRHFSTVSPFTQSAVPALLDGRDPEGEPIWTDHPDNLFSLLANSHHLTVSESLTKLCGFEVCSGEPVPPPDDPGDEAATPSTSPQWNGVLADARAVWMAMVRPGPSGSAGALDDFEEEMATPAESTDGSDANGEIVEVPESQQLDGFFASSGVVQPERLDRFLDALRPTPDPFFGFLHLVIPHQPWFAREDGTRYATPGEYRGPDIDTPWRARVTRQRHLLQAEYADRLVGQVLAHLREIDEYDDSLVVVVSDHGASFEPGESVRSVEDDNLDEIAYAPLLIKAPGQEAGVVDDSNLLSVDVAPTIADLLGTEPNWDVDGVAAGDVAAIRRRGDDKYLYSYTDAFTYDFLGIEEFDDDEAYRAMAADRFPSVDPDDSRLAGLYEGVPGATLIGEPADDVLRSDVGGALVRDLDVLEQPDDEATLLGEVVGIVPGARSGDTVVVAVNGTVIGVSPVFEEGGVPDQFVVLLPAGALRSEDNEIRAGVLRADGETADELTLVDAD